MLYCPSCMFEITRPLPVEPVYTLDEVSVIVPIVRNTLNQILRREKVRLSTVGEPLYKRTKGGRFIRVLRAREVRMVRAIHLHVHHSSGYVRLITLEDLADGEIANGTCRSEQTNSAGIQPGRTTPSSDGRRRAFG